MAHRRGWQEYGLTNKVDGIPAPILSKLILPSLEQTQVHYLIEKAPTIRDKAIIALLTESGLRFTELANIRLPDIDWENRTIRKLPWVRVEKKPIHRLVSSQRSICNAGYRNIILTVVYGALIVGVYRLCLSGWGKELAYPTTPTPSVVPLLAY